MSFPASLALKIVHFNPTQISWRWLSRHHIAFYFELFILTILGLVLTLSVEAAVDNTLVQPKIAFTDPTDGYIAQDLANPITIEFTNPISRTDIKVSFNPTIEGDLKFVKSPFGEHFIRKIIFQPKVTLKPNTNYLANISNIHSVAGFDDPYNFSFKFKTINLPKVAATFPQAGVQELSVKDSIYLKLNYPNNYAANFSFNLVPQTAFSATLNDSHSAYIIKPNFPLKHSTSYELTVEKSEISYDLANKKILSEGNKILDQKVVFTTLTEPKVSYVSASGDTAARGPITITFNKDMLRSSVEEKLTATTLADYNLVWNDNKNLVITPKAELAYGTTYTITFGAGTQSLDGSYFETDYTHTFTTIGNVKVGQFSPANGATGVKIGSKILVYFNQAVDKNSAQAHFSITPNVSGSFGWDGNTLIFSPTANLNYLESYTVTISSGIKSISALDSVSNFSATFKTADLYEIIKLSVPIYKQKYSLSCEFANMSMVLAFKGIGRSEDQLIAETNFDNTPKTETTWGDPSAGFVGSVNGTYFVDGYGAYYPVVAGVLSRYRAAESHVGWNLTSLLKEVKAGNPAIIWSCLICNGPRYWNASDGKQIYAYEYYHLLTVVGYTGKPENPETITVNDSIYGRQLTWSKSQFLSKWASMNNTAIVVK